MSASKLSDLLPIQASDTQPNAYEVFGLAVGEQDRASVSVAIQRVYTVLKESKATAEPAVWKQAAKLAETSRKILEDPERRQALDASLGIESFDGGGHGASAGRDPLADLLPTVNPIKPSPSEESVETKPKTTNAAASVLGMSGAGLGTPPLGTTDAGSSAAKHNSSDTSESPKVVVADQRRDRATPITSTGGGPIGWTPPKEKRKRRKKNGGLFVFGLFVLVMLGAIIALLQFLSSGGRIAVNRPGPQDLDGDGRAVAPPMEMTDRAKPNRRQSDGILNNVPSSGVAESLRQGKPAAEQPPGSGVSQVDPGGAKNGPQLEMSPAENQSPAMRESDAMNSQPETTAAEPATTPNEAVPDDPTPSEPSPAMVQANDSKIKSVEELIIAADWQKMKPAADALLKLDLTSSQSDRASTLYDIADLAMYYRGAIGRGLGTLNTGSTFEVVEDFPVIVVAVSPDSLSIQFNRKTKEYSIDELPPRLTEKIASFALPPEKPDSIAGLALYRLIHPGTNEEYRAQAIEDLASVDGQLEKVDTSMLQKVAKELLSK